MNSPSVKHLKHVLFTKKIVFTALKYEVKFHNSRTSIEHGQLVEEELLPKPQDAGTRQSCILKLPEKNQIFYYSILAIDQVLI